VVAVEYGLCEGTLLLSLVSRVQTLHSNNAWSFIWFRRLIVTYSSFATIMPKKFTVALITKASQDFYRYERIAEEHSVILRKDLEGSNRAHQEYTANSPPMGFLPSRDEFDRYIEESEKVLKKKCITLLEYVTCYMVIVC
jgi:hypothetical protein